MLNVLTGGGIGFILPLTVEICEKMLLFRRGFQFKGAAMEKTLLDLDRLPTMEELRAFFKDHDRSAARIPMSWKKIYNTESGKQ